jgi:hypothetical protein
MMNAKKLEQWILLEQTGELSPRKQKILNACQDAKAKRKELNALMAVVSPVDVEPSPWTTTRINARLQKERRSVLLPARVWQPIVALAACLTLVVTTFDFPAKKTVPATVIDVTYVPDIDDVAAVAVDDVDAWGAAFEEDLAELEGLILAISDSPLDIMEM